MSSFEVDYEEDLVPRIRDLIDGYDKDSILKEYLQNADDAGATELIITFDNRKYKNLKNTIFEPAYETALLIYNNSQFKDKDFKSIVKISAQGKNDDANSTGRFGQGFSSSFSISDHPSFISNGKVYWFDILKIAVSYDKNKSIQYWEYQKSDDINNWLQTFKVAGFTNDFKGTIFRLPLRNEKSSKESKISSEIFTYVDFLKWVEEWRNGSENLLFLRHIHRLVLQEADKDGKVKILLDIKTKNEKEIENINNKIQNEFNDKTLMHICEFWETYNEELPLFKYKHQFEINYYGQIKHKNFMVINGLFRGKNNSLINLAKKVLKITPNPRKVLPWAGVAIEINDKNEHIKTKSKFFTFLPLPIKSLYSIHIHGWFDLNSKRTEITNSGSGYDKETLINWNQLLLKEGIAKAWSLLIDYIKKDSKVNYNFWAKDTEFVLNDCLIKGFYENISNLDCLYTIYKNKKEWLSPKENQLYYIGNEANKILLNALQKHFKVILSKPQKYIIGNFKKVGIELTEITPEFLRNYLKEKSKDIEFPVSLKDMPIKMLQQKECFIEVLKFCANNGEDYSLLERLPLELTLDGNIDNIGSSILFTKKPNLSLFQDMKYLFIDMEVVNSIDIQKDLPTSWLEPTLENQLSLLYGYWEELLLSKEWIKEVVDLIINSTSDEFEEALEQINKLEIVYQRNEKYARLESNIDEYSPFMLDDKDSESNLIYLEETEMNIVHQDYIDIYKPLLKYKKLITQLTPKTLIKHILLLDDFSFFDKKDTRDYLVDILQEDISWFDELSDDEKIRLETIPFIETDAEKNYSKDTDKKLYLPTDFTPLKDIKSLQGEYELISVETGTNLYKLYQKMGFTQQGFDNYIREIIVPYLKNSDNTEDKKDVLKWLAVSWHKNKDTIDENTIKILKSEKIIPTLLDEKKLYKASELYLPDVDLGKVFNDGLYMPIGFKDKDTQDYWIEFLKELGASKIVLVNHTINKIEKILNDKNVNNLAVDLLNYMVNHFEIFENMIYEGKRIFDFLKYNPFFPVEKINDILKPKNDYTSLKKATEIILKDDYKIAGGCYFVLDKRVKLSKKNNKDKYIAERLGIVTDVPDGDIYKSFRELIKADPTNGKVVNFTKEVYKYIGRRFKGEEILFEEDEKTILLNKQWIEPKYVYQTKINLTNIYSWDSLVKDNTESNLAKGLISLGIKEKPTFEFLVEQLYSMPQEEKLKDRQLKDAKALLKYINSYDKAKTLVELPILTQHNTLVSSSKLYINDLPAYKNAKDRNEDLLFCQIQFNDLAQKINVLELSKNICSEIYEYEECETSHKSIEILKTDFFKEGILRLLYHDNKINKDEISESILQEVLPSNLIFVSKLVIDYFIEESFLYRSDETSYENNGKLYILEQEDEEDLIEIIAKYICDTKDLSRDSFGWIERIFRKQMSREEIRVFLDNKKVKELPQKFDLDDEISLFDDSLSSDMDNKTIDDLGLSLEENDFKKYVKYQNDDEIKSSIEQENLSVKKDNISKTTSNQKYKKEKKEKAPPIQPKISSTTAIKVSERKSLKRDNKENINYLPTDIKRVHVYPAKQDKNENKEKNPLAETLKEKGDRGENYIIKNQVDFVQSKDNYLEKATKTNNKGFDIYEKDKKGDIVRYIEVKSKDTEWGENGVAITKSQLEFAKKEKEKWWLFVVENSKTTNPIVYQFKNPVLQIDRFMFDSSWKQLAYKSEDKDNQKPKIGDRYEIEIEGNIKIGEVIGIKGKGALSKVELALENGQKVSKKFSKAWRKIDG